MFRNGLAPIVRPSSCLRLFCRLSFTSWTPSLLEAMEAADWGRLSMMSPSNLICSSRRSQIEILLSYIVTISPHYVPAGWPSPSYVPEKLEGVPVSLLLYQPSRSQCNPQPMDLIMAIPAEWEVLEDGGLPLPWKRPSLKSNLRHVRNQKVCFVSIYYLHKFVSLNSFNLFFGIRFVYLNLNRLEFSELNATEL